MSGTDLFDLTGRVAAVVGGTGVLGGAICDGLAAAGASVAVIGRSRERADDRVRAVMAQGGRALAVLADVTDRVAVERACAQVTEAFGPADVLVNAPGVNSSTAFFDIDEPEWQRVMGANLRAVVIATQVFARAMIEAGIGGSIINLSSASSGPPLSRVFTYSIAKAGINNMTQYLARELAPHRIRVNAIAPGFFPAEQNRALLSEERVAAILAHTPAGRLGNPDELVGTAIWLAAERASGFVTGAIVRVDGGFSAMTI